MLPVRLALDRIGTGSPDRIYGDVTTEPDGVFEARVRRFVAAVLRGDRRTASGIVSCPLRLYGARTGVVATRRALLARWKGVFTPTIMAGLREAVPHDMFTRNGEAALGGGEMWFDATGLASLDEGGHRH